MPVTKHDLVNGEPVQNGSRWPLWKSTPQQQYAPAAQPLEAAPAEAAPARNPGLDPTTRILLSVIILAFGVPQWIVSARFTVDGWVVWVNMFLDWMGFPFVLPRLAGLPLLVGAVIVGFLYSRVEINAFPIRRTARGWVRLSFLALVGWLFLGGTDVGSTYQGIIVPDIDAMPLWRDVAANSQVAAIAAFYLTFAPDWIILGAIRLLFGGR